MFFQFQFILAFLHTTIFVYNRLILILTTRWAGHPQIKFCHKFKEGFISPEIFIYFFINSDLNLTQTQMLTLKLFLNRTLTQTLT